MKKKILAVLLTAAMTLGLAACGSTGGGNAGGGADTQGGNVSAGDENNTAGDTVKIGIVLDVGGVSDGSFNQSAWEGLQRAQAELGIEAQYLESAGDADYAANIENFMDEGCDLIICVGYMLADATRAAAEANPDQKFAIIDDSTCADLPNVACLMFKQEQASYLVGYVAGLMTETNNVGFVIGMANDNMNLFGYGYYAGVKDANPDANVSGMNANSFADAETGKANANAMITNGADIIFHAAGGTGLGVIDACKEAGIMAIGVDSDQSRVAPETVITSAMKRVDNAVYDTAEKVLNGTYTAGVITYDLSAGGVDIAPTQDLLTAEVIAKIEEIKQQIIDGTIVVPDSKDAFEAAYGDIYELD